MSDAEVWRTSPSIRGGRAGMGISEQAPRGAALLLALMLLGCAAGPSWERPERSLAENRADYAACEETTYRRLRAEFGYEVAMSGGSVPGFPSQNPIPPFPASGSRASSATEDPLLRQDIEAARMRADFRRRQLMRECLTGAGFRSED